MGIVLDYTARISPAALASDGVVGVCRYLKPLSVPAYAITPTEYRELVGAGVAVTLNWEYDSHDWLGGASRGAAHGTEAARQARQVIGYPDGGVLVGSADFDMTRAEWDSAGRPYAQAFATAIRAAGFRPGVYGPWDVLTWVRDAGIMDAFWQSMSTAFSQGRNANAWPGVHLWQRGYRTVAGQQTDWNEIRIPDWGRAKEEDMTPIESAKLDAIYNLRDRTGLNPGDKPDAYAVPLTAYIKALGAKVDALAHPAAVALTDADRAAIAAQVVEQLGPLLPTLSEIEGIVDAKVRSIVNGTHLSA